MSTEPNLIVVAGHSIGATQPAGGDELAPCFSRRRDLLRNRTRMSRLQALSRGDLLLRLRDDREFEMRSALCYAPAVKCPLIPRHRELRSPNEPIDRAGAPGGGGPASTWQGASRCLAIIYRPLAGDPRDAAFFFAFLVGPGCLLCYLMRIDKAPSMLTATRGRPMAP